MAVDGMQGEGRRRRLLNQHRRSLFQERADRPIVFVCECGAPDCAAGVLLTASEYDARRPDLIVSDGHSSEHGARRDERVPSA